MRVVTVVLWMRPRLLTMHSLEFRIERQGSWIHSNGFSWKRETPRSKPLGGVALPTSDSRSPEHHRQYVVKKEIEIGVFAGQMNYDWILGPPPPSPSSSSSSQGIARVVVEEGGFGQLVGASVPFFAARTSYLLGLSGPSVVVDTACSSSLVAVCLGAEGIHA